MNRWFFFCDDINDLRGWYQHQTKSFTIATADCKRIAGSA